MLYPVTIYSRNGSRSVHGYNVEADDEYQALQTAMLWAAHDGLVIATMDQVVVHEPGPARLERN